MTEAQDDPTGTDQQGAQAREQGRPADGGEGASPGEQMARGLVEDIAAFEVDPPPPARAQRTPRGTSGSDPAE